MNDSVPSVPSATSATSATSAVLLTLLVDLPALTWLADPDATPAFTEQQVAVTAEKLTYQPDTMATRGVADVWNLAAEAPAIHGALEWDGPAPRMRCPLPAPTAGEVALYRITILKTGVTLDTEGKERADHLLPTEEELFFFVIGARDDGSLPADIDQPLLPGVQYVVIPPSRPSSLS